jgi:prolyl oligopeptidase
MRVGTTLAIIAALVSGAPARGAEILDDPYLWLEDVHGEKPLAWVRQENARTLQTLTADAEYAADYESVLAVLDAQDRIPFGGLEQNFVFNFWQDAAHPKGLWRRTTIADYATPAPHWDVLLDIGALSADERENWVYKGADCTPSLARCLVSLSRGGGDAVVIREFDMNGRTFLADGFALPEAKSTATYEDDDTILFATAKDAQTGSGYPRIVRRWKRGTPLSRAATIYEGKTEDVSVDPFVLRGNSGALAMVSRATSFFEAEYYLVDPDGKITRVPLPLSAQIHGVHFGQMIASLRDAWTPPGSDAELPKGALISISIRNFARDNLPLKPLLLYAPGQRAAIESVSVRR